MQIGKIGQTLEGNYDSSIAYNILDTVAANGGSYTSRIPNNTQPLTNESAWQKTAEKGDSDPNYYNKSTSGNIEVASNIIKRIGFDSKQVLSYVETLTNGEAPISDSDLTSDKYFIKEGNKYYVQILPAIIDVRNLGMIPGQNCGAIFQRMITRLKNIGGSFYFPASDSDYIFEQQIIFPYEVISNTPTQRPFSILGSGSYWNAKSIGLNGKKGSCIQLAYNGNGSYLDSKIISYGLGKITIKDMTLEDLSGDNTPFFYGTFTTWLVENNAFLGSKFRDSCDQDVFVFGGTDQTEVGNNPNGGFQGYGTIVRGNYFNKIRRGVVGHNYFNGNTISDNTFWFDCGNTQGGAIEFISSAVQACTGNVISGNLVEMIAYKNFFKGNGANNNSFMCNNLFDTHDALATPSYYDLTNSKYNTIINGWHTDICPLIIGDDEQTIINPHQGQLSKIEALEVNGINVVSTDPNIIEGARMSIAGASIFQRYIVSSKELQTIRRNPDNSETIISAWKDFNDGYYSYKLQGVDPRIDSLEGMRVRVGITKELYIGENGGKGILLLNGGMRLNPTTSAEVLQNSLFIDSSNGKLAFKDSLDVVNYLY